MTAVARKCRVFSMTDTPLWEWSIVPKKYSSLYGEWGYSTRPICWAPSSPRRCRPEEALYLPSFSHLLVVNKLLSLSLSRSLSLSIALSLCARLREFCDVGSCRSPPIVGTRKTRSHKNHLGGRGLMVPRFAHAVLRSGSSGSGLTWLRPHMALAIDHVRVMQRVAGPEA
jgi:hypothetical protein